MIKKYDKVICIKNYSKINEHDQNDAIKLKFQAKKDYENNLLTKSEFFEQIDIIDNLSKNMSLTTYLTKGKTYTVLGVLLNEVKVLNDANKIEYFIVDNSIKASEHVTLNFYDYFENIKEYRKQKLEQIDDVNFSNFLKKSKLKSDGKPK